MSELTQENYELGVRVRELESENASLRAENEDLIWNLAGCSTFAMGYKLDEPFAKEKARAAMYDVLKLANRWVMERGNGPSEM